ncbi:MAG TPA: glycerophosphodiester phosphodiesterase family protein [Pseudogracilibacillus sp.]|nr:glycerophosphodiester phosphodiesterase family protein [Pseudogracilibacillus sp.]
MTNMVLNFAHRGSLTEAPENTLSAVKKALSHGAKAIELDVQLTKDGELVVIHDHHLKRFTKETTKLIKELTLEEIKQLDIGSAFSQAYEGETLATLSEILSVCPSEVLLNIEIKNIPVIYQGIEEKLLYCLEKHQRIDNSIVSSFDHAALQNLQNLHSEIKLGMLFYYRILRPWEYIQNSGLNVYSFHPNIVTVDKEMIKASHDAGLKIYPYTVNEMTSYNALMEAGADGVFSNNPHIFAM